jgi:peptidoglycan/xylan/chitin deacetylase (PgdA/CDA1 family)
MSRTRRLRPWALPVALSSLGAGYVLPSVLVVPSFWRTPPIGAPAGVCRWRSGSMRPEVALTFDDGPDARTPDTLDLLDELGLSATFFLLGSQIRAYPEVARLIVSRGHEVGTHGDRHRRHLLSPPAAIRRDLAAAVQTHHRILGEPPRFYRPPYGQIATPTLLAARALGLHLVLWSRWGKEFAETEVGPVIGRLEPGLCPGAIVLLHDNDVCCRPGTGDLTRRALGPLARILGERGLRSVTLGQMLQPEEWPAASPRLVRVG